MKIKSNDTLKRVKELIERKKELEKDTSEIDKLKGQLKDLNQELNDFLENTRKSCKHVYLEYKRPWPATEPEYYKCCICEQKSHEKQESANTLYISVYLNEGETVEQAQRKRRLRELSYIPEDRKEEQEKIEAEVERLTNEIESIRKKLDDAVNKRLKEINRLEDELLNISSLLAGYFKYTCCYGPNEHGCAYGLVLPHYSRWDD